MTDVITYGDEDGAMKMWLLTTPVAALLTRGDGGVSIFLSMPKGSPIPSLIINRIGGGPRARKDIPESVVRYTYSCWGNTRDEASTIARTLIAELENLARTRVDVNALGVQLYAAEVMNVRWLPDPDSDRPRVIVDAMVTTVTT